MSKSDRVHANSGLLKHAKKPDVDNLIKLYMDVLTGIVWHDDNCVSLGSAVKVYSSKPRVEMFVECTDKILTMDELWEGTWPTM